MSTRLQFAVALLIALAGCAARADAPSVPASAPDFWPMYQFAPTHNAVFSRPSFEVSWVRRLGDRINGGLAVVGDTVFAVSFDRYLYALDAFTGHVRWRQRAANILMSTPVVADNVVIIGSGHNGFLYPSDPNSQVWGDPKGDDVIAFDTRSGKRLWTFHTIGEDMPSPAVVGNRVVFANGDLHAYALDLHSGKQLWKVPLPGIDTMASITTDRGLAIIGTCRINPHKCVTVALDVRTGREAWRNDHGGSDPSATVADGIVFTDGWRAGSERFRPGGGDVVAALDQHSGRTLWEYNAGEGPYTLVASAEHHITDTYADGVLYQSIANQDEVVAFEARTGKIRWRTRTYAPVKMSAVVTSDRVYFGDTAGLIYDLDRRTGEILHTSAMDKPFSTAPFVVIGDSLFLANSNNVVATPLRDL